MGGVDFLLEVKQPWPETDFSLPSSTTGTAVAQWLRYCTINQKVVGSIPDGVMEFFIDINPSDRIMALGSTQPLTEMRPVRKADNLTTILCRCQEIWEP
jgi:hypothetical protein